MSDLKKEVDNVTEQMKHFFWNDPPLIVTHMHQLRDSYALDAIVNSNKEEISRWQNLGSDWVIDKILTVYLEFARYVPIRGGTYIPTPSKLRSKQAIINIKNRDDQCLRWALRAAWFPVQVHVDRPGSYPVEDGLDFTGIDFPTLLDQISKVESLNNLAINLFGWQNNKTVIIRVSEVEDPNVRRINLMLLTGRNTTHYCYIRSLSRLLPQRVRRRAPDTFFVRGASKGFPQNGFLMTISSTAGESKAGRYVPKCQRKEKNTLFFENYQNQMKKSWVVYADFESSTTAKAAQRKRQCTSPAASACWPSASDGKTKGPYLYRGADVVQGFLHYLQLLEREIREELRAEAPLNMTRGGLGRFQPRKILPHLQQASR